VITFEYESSEKMQLKSIILRLDCNVINPSMFYLIMQFLKPDNSRTIGNKMKVFAVRENYSYFADIVAINGSDPYPAGHVPGLPEVSMNVSKLQKNSDKESWLKLHTEQQTVMIDQWAEELRKIREENERLRFRLLDTDEKVAAFEQLCLDNGVRIPYSLRSTRRFRQKRNKKNRNHVLVGESFAKSQSPHSVRSGASTIVTRNNRPSKLDVLNEDEVLRQKPSNNKEKSTKSFKRIRVLFKNKNLSQKEGKKERLLAHA